MRQVIDRELFVDLVVQLGEEHALTFNAKDVDEALRANRRAWLEGWL